MGNGIGFRAAVGTRVCPEHGDLHAIWADEYDADVPGLAVAPSVGSITQLTESRDHERMADDGCPHHDRFVKEDGDAIGVPEAVRNSYCGKSAVRAAGVGVRHTEDCKATNPKDAVGTAKAPISTVPLPVMLEVGLAMLEGARKYGRHNYRAAGVRASVYVDALFRHIAAFWEGEDVDPDSGLSHIVKAIACLAVLRDSQMQENWVDDRPPVSRKGWVADLNRHAAALIQKYPKVVEAWTEGRIADEVKF